MNNPYAFLHKSNMDKIFEDWPKIHQKPSFWIELNEFQLVLSLFGIFSSLEIRVDVYIHQTFWHQVTHKFSLNLLNNVIENFFQNVNIFANWIKTEETFCKWNEMITINLTTFQSIAKQFFYSFMERNLRIGKFSYIHNYNSKCT